MADKVLETFSNCNNSPAIQNKIAVDFVASETSVMSRHVNQDLFSVSAISEGSFSLSIPGRGWFVFKRNHNPAIFKVFIHHKGRMK